MEITLSERYPSQQKDSILSDTHVQPTLLKKIGKNQSRFDGLKGMDIWAYSLGHFLNDMTATCWFNYLLFFLTEVVQTDAGPYAILAGQLADGISTPIVGALSDRIKTRIGQRKPWYILGCILVICGFVPTFQNYSGDSDNKAGETAYYIIFPSLFNVGWAALQISHMSLVPSLSCSRKRRDRLNNLRNSFAFIANLIVLILGLIIFSSMADRSLEISLISYIVVIVGAITSSFFIFKIDEPRLSEAALQKSLALREELLQTQESPRFSNDPNPEEMITLPAENPEPIEKWHHWFKQTSFYVFGVCYTGVRLYANLFGTLLPFYLIYVLKLGSKEIDKIPFAMALVQLLVYISSVTTSLALTRIYSIFGRKNALLLGGGLCIISAISMIFLNKNFTWPIYLIALVIGASQSMTLSTGINLISEVVGAKSKQGAIVFGIYSLFDKFTSGIIIFAISSSTLFKEKEAGFIKLMTVVVPSAACLLSCVLVYFNPVKEYNKNTDSDLNNHTALEEELVV